MNRADWPEQLFIISDDILTGVTRDDIEASYADMLSLGIANAPYENYAIQFHATAAAKLDAFDMEDCENNTTFAYNYHIQNGEVVSVATYVADGWGFLTDDEIDGHCIDPELEIMKKVLVVILASKGITSEVKENKRMMLRGASQKKPRYRYTTTININPALYEHHGGGGWTVRPHLRRGHIKRVRYGPKRGFVRRVWIDPCFVNGNGEGFVSARDHYNVIGDNHATA